MTRELPGEIKRLGKADLVTLARRARDLHLSVGRRAEWITEHVQDGRVAFLRACLHESSPQPCSYRALILAARTDGASEHFPLDVLPEAFEALPNAEPAEVVGLARWALDRVPISALPPEYEAEWQQHRHSQGPVPNGP